MMESTAACPVNDDELATRFGGSEEALERVARQADALVLRLLVRPDADMSDGVPYCVVSTYSDRILSAIMVRDGFDADEDRLLQWLKRLPEARRTYDAWARRTWESGQGRQPTVEATR